MDNMHMEKMKIYEADDEFRGQMIVVFGKFE